MNRIMRNVRRVTSDVDEMTEGELRDRVNVLERCRQTHGDRIADLTERCDRLRRELRRYVARGVVAEIERGDA